MKYLLTLIVAAGFLLTVKAQDYVTDATMEDTVMTQDDQLKVLYFTATWCGPCRIMAPTITSIAQDDAVDVSIYKMDIDKNITDDILGINAVPTYLFIKNGRKLGQAGSVIRRNKMVAMIERHDKMDATGDLLPYKGMASQYEIIAGANPKLSIKNIKQIWYRAPMLNEVAWTIYQKLEVKKDLECALNLANRSIELNKTTSSLETRAHLLYKLNRIKEAKKAAKKAKTHATKNKEFTGIIDDLIEKIEQS